MTSPTDESYRLSTLDVLRRKGKHGLSGMLESIRADLITALEAGAPLDTGVRASIPAFRVGEPDVVLSIALIPAKPSAESNGDARVNANFALNRLLNRLRESVFAELKQLPEIDENSVEQYLDTDSFNAGRESAYRYVLALINLDLAGEIGGAQ